MRPEAMKRRTDTLDYLIEMAYFEASDIIRGQRPSPIQGEQGDRTAGVPLKPPRKI